MGIEIVNVENQKDLMKFIKLQFEFYKNDPNFVPPVIADRKKLLDESKNPFYKHSQIKHFLAKRDDKYVGRISAIINNNHNETHMDKVGFFGFFECENNKETAQLLFRSAENWLNSKGMTECRGPVNPSMNDEVGLLIDGFDSPPVVLMTYNPEYYVELIESSGYTKAKDLYAYQIVEENFMTNKLVSMHNIVKERYKIEIRSINFGNKVQFEKDVKTIKEIYNKAWEPNWGFVKMTDEEFDFLAKDLKQFAWEELAMILEINGKPVGFALGLPDINQCLIHNKSGSLLGALWHLTTKKKLINTFRVIVLGVLPEFQGKGIDAVMYYDIGVRCAKLNIVIGEASWILEDNEMMKRGMTQIMNSKLYKKYRLYEKNIN